MYYNSLQYVGKKPWKSPGPIETRQPKVIIPLYRLAVDTLDSFIWGDFPQVIVNPTVDDGESPSDVGPLLKQQQSKDLTTFVCNLIKRTELDLTMREGSRRAIVTTSAAIVAGVKGGNVVAQTVPGQHCTPTFNPNNPKEVIQLDIIYQFEAEEPTIRGSTTRVLYWFRRTIDEQYDTVYKIVPVRDGFTPDWEIDPKKTVRHGLGFCPVKWIRTAPSCADDIDGQPVIDPSLYSVIDCLNYVLSMRDRSAHFFLDPQWVRKGVPRSQRDEIQKNPGMMWDIEAGADVSLVEAKGFGAETASKHIDDLRERFLEAAQVVIVDPQLINARVSSSVLETMHRPMVALAKALRRDLGDNGYCGLINLVLRIISTVKARGEDVWIPGVTKAAKIISDAQLAGPWLDFPITLQWGPFFALTVEDQNLKVQSAVMASQSGVATKYATTQYLTDVFAIFDVDAERDAADLEQAAQMDAMGAGMPAAGVSPPKPKQPKATAKDPAKDS